MPPTSIPVAWDCHEHSRPADEIASREARELLRSSGYFALARLECCVELGVLELRGRVGTYYLKQLAQAMVLRVASIREVKNSIEVAGPGLDRALVV